MTRFVSILLLCALCGFIQTAQSVELTWDRSSSTNVLGYNVYWFSAFTNRMDVGDTTNAVVDDLIVGVTYGFFVTAYSTNSLESDPSNVAIYTVRPKPPFLREDHILLTWSGPWEVLESTNLLTGFSVIGTTDVPWFTLPRDYAANHFFRVRSGPTVLKLSFSPAP